MSSLAPKPLDRELRERCLELAVRAEPERAVERAKEYLAFVNGDQRSSESL